VYKIVGYRDMRPVDWLSGKRVPLEPGEGHICDRCGAEHAVIYEIEDTVTGKRYSVGSGCAKQQFGFEPDKTREIKTLLKAEKDRMATEIDDARQRAAEETAQRIASSVLTLPVPEPVADTERYKPTVAWRVGDGLALAAHGRTNAEASRLATHYWFEKRTQELVPQQFFGVELLLNPGKKDRTKIDLGRKTMLLAMQLIGS